MVNSLKYRLQLLPLAVIALLSISSRLPDNQSQKGVTYLDLVEQADSAIAAADWNGAESLLSEAIELCPDIPGKVMLMSNLGVVRFNAGRDSSAIEVLNQANAVAPASVTVLSNRARIYGAMGDIVRAYSDFGRVIELDSTLTEPLYYHALMAIELGDIERAEANIKRLESLEPESVEAHIARAAFFVASGDEREALRQYDWLIENSPSAMFYSARADFYMRKGFFTEASADIAEAMKLEPNDGELYLQRSLLNKLRYRPADAKEDARMAQKLGVSPARIKQLGL